MAIGFLTASAEGDGDPGCLELADVVGFDVVACGDVVEFEGGEGVVVGEEGPGGLLRGGEGVDVGFNGAVGGGG